MSDRSQAAYASAQALASQVERVRTKVQSGEALDEGEKFFVLWTLDSVTTVVRNTGWCLATYLPES